jgi:osmotically inducible protein OsmC
MKRSASAAWFGDLRTGDGTLMSHSGALDQVPYTYANRFEQSPGTNPEELLAAAHASCFAMAVCAALVKAGHSPRRLSTQAVVSFELVEGRWTVLGSHLELRAAVADLDAERFGELVGDAKESCPISRALRVPITLDARLDERR